MKVNNTRVCRLALPRLIVIPLFRMYRIRGGYTVKTSPEIVRPATIRVLPKVPRLQRKGKYMSRIPPSPVPINTTTGFLSLEGFHTPKYSQYME